MILLALVIIRPDQLVATAELMVRLDRASAAAAWGTVVSAAARIAAWFRQQGDLHRSWAACFGVQGAWLARRLGDGREAGGTRGVTAAAGREIADC